MADANTPARETSLVTIEFTAPSMGFVVFNPCEERRFRSRWNPRDLPPGTTFIPGSKAQQFVVPGERFELDIANRKARGYDPLNLPEYATLCKKLSSSSTSYTGQDPSHYRNLSDDDIATYLHWMAEFVKRGYAELLPGSAPIPKPAPKSRIEVDRWNGSQDPKTKRFLHEFERQGAPAGAA